MPTYSFELSIEDPIGLHARPAGQIVLAVQQSGLPLKIGRAGQPLVSASGPLALLALKGKSGEILVLEIEAERKSQAEQLAEQIREALRGPSD